MNISEIILYLSSLLLIWQFVGYPLFMSIIAFYRRTEGNKYFVNQFFSIIVPTYNESAVIERRIENLLELDYPKNLFEIIVVDSGSNDSTRRMVENLIKKNNSEIPNLILINEGERRGKASAINLGVRHSKGTIIMICDANSLYDKDVLNKITPHFEDPNVGAVSGRYLISNPSESLPSCESFYWDLEHVTSMGESELDSISTVVGTISAWRRDLANFRSDTVTEDLDMTITVRSLGYRILYEPKAIVYESSARTTEDQIKQRRRTGQGTIQNIYTHIKYFLLPRDLYSILIFPSHKTLTMLSPFMLLIIPAIYVLIGNPEIILIHFMLTLFVFSLLFVLLFFSKSRLIGESGNKQSTNLNIMTILKIIHYVILNEYIILLAWKDCVMGNSTILWEKAESTRM